MLSLQKQISFQPCPVTQLLLPLFKVACDAVSEAWEDRSQPTLAQLRSVREPLTTAGGQNTSVEARRNKVNRIVLNCLRKASPVAQFTRSSCSQQNRATHWQSPKQHSSHWVSRDLVSLQRYNNCHNGSQMSFSPSSFLTKTWLPSTFMGSQEKMYEYITAYFRWSFPLFSLLMLFVHCFTRYKASNTIELPSRCNWLVTSTYVLSILQTYRAYINYKMLLPIPRFNTGKRLSKIASILFLELFLPWLRRKHLRTQLHEPRFARLALSSSDWMSCRLSWELFQKSSIFDGIRLTTLPLSFFDVNKTVLKSTPSVFET